MLSSITPVVLTYNESPNIGRALERLSWANDIVVVDSFSTDETVDILKSASKVRLFQRRFDGHAAQWNFALTNTGIATDWVLCLDADYILPTEFVEELSRLHPRTDVVAFSSEFDYVVGGRTLRSSVYPPVITLFRSAYGRYLQDGHTQRLSISGRVEKLVARIEHDDRKSLSRWVTSQAAYMRLEAQKLAETPVRDLSVADVARKLLIVAPPLMFLYALFVRGLILDGWPGLYYALQRATAEAILSLALLERMMDRSGA